MKEKIFFHQPQKWFENDLLEDVKPFPSGVNFINVLQAAFALEDSKSTKIHS